MLFAGAVREWTEYFHRYSVKPPYKEVERGTEVERSDS